MSDSNIKFVNHPVGFRIFYVFFGDDVQECLEIQVIQVPETDIERKLFDIALVAWSRRLKKSASREFLFMQDASRGEVMLSAYGLKRYLVRMRARVSREDGSIYVGGEKAIPSPTVENVGAIASEARIGTGLDAISAEGDLSRQADPVPVSASAPAPAPIGETSPVSAPAPAPVQEQASAPVAESASADEAETDVRPEPVADVEDKPGAV